MLFIPAEYVSSPMNLNSATPSHCVLVRRVSLSERFLDHFFHSLICFSHKIHRYSLENPTRQSPTVLLFRGGSLGARSSSIRCFQNHGTGVLCQFDCKVMDFLKIDIRHHNY